MSLALTTASPLYLTPPQGQPLQNISEDLLKLTIAKIHIKTPFHDQWENMTMPSEFLADDSSSSRDDSSSEEHILALLDQIQDWQINHGSLLKIVKSQTKKSGLSYAVGVSVVPTAFPKSQFHQAMNLQPTYNELYMAISRNEDWLYNVTKELIPLEPLVCALWEVYQESKAAGIVQNISAGIFRSDYMLHLDDSQSDSLKSSLQARIKQVEFNTFSCAGASHAKKVADMHRYLTRVGAYNYRADTEQQTRDVSSIPDNNNIESLASFLASAHAVYGPPKCKKARQTAVLYIVQPHNFNIADERPIEYALWEREEPVPTYRLNWGDDILQFTTLTDTRELLFHPPWLKAEDPVEVSVVYLRAGYETHEYDLTGRQARLRLEISSAIKCPSILSHISTLKKVQQALTAPGELEKFLSSEKAARIRETFAMIHPLNHTREGLYARKLVHDENCSNFILKPSLEGGGHNIHTGIPEFLASIPTSEWSSYILMERIQPPTSRNVLMGSAGVDEGQVVSELGVVGACLWKNSNTGYRSLQNTSAGWTFKTKYADVHEMSVVKGYGCFDTPYLLED